MRPAEGPFAVQLRAGAGSLPATTRRGRARFSRLALSAVGVSLLGAALLADVAPSGASNIQVFQAEARALAVKVDTLDTRLSILSEEYDQAENRANALDQEVRIDAKSLTTAEHNVQSEDSLLRKQAIYAYVNAGAGGISFNIATSANAIPLQQTYLKAASGNIVTTVSSLQNSEHRLDVQRSTLQKVDAEARANAQGIASEKAAASTLEQQVSSSLAGVNSQLAAAVAQQEAEEQAAAQQAAASQAARAAAQAASAPQPQPSSPAASTGVGSGNGEAAVQDAARALGVPYVWGGASMSGFDCSGLVMWAWAQAGVSLPHSAMDQYETVAHVSLSDLEPGDLIFYADGGYVYHVVMYAGNGQVIQAENFGTDVMYTPIPPGAYAAGRP